MAFDLGSLLGQYLGGATAPNDQADAHFDEAAKQAPPDVLQSGLSAMFHDQSTPPFGQMAGQMFGQADPNQRAGMLNHLITAMGPAVLGSLMHGSGGVGAGGGAASGGVLGGLGGLLSSLTGGGAAPQVTPAQASTLSPDQVQVIADHAEKADPSIIDRMSGFYAQHPQLVKTLGSAALTIALARMAQHTRG